MAITAFVDKLDSAAPITKKKQIAFIYLPKEYKNNYIPALTKSNRGTYTEENLLSDMNQTLNYYKKKDNIQC